MIDNRTKAAMAYLDEARPKGEPWTYDDARRWLETDMGREARAFRAALDAIEVL